MAKACSTLFHSPFPGHQASGREALTHALLETVRLVLEEQESEEEERNELCLSAPIEAIIELNCQAQDVDCSEHSEEPSESCQPATPKRPAKVGVPGGPCAHCGASESPQWRRPLTKNVVLCNACGIYYSRHHSLPRRKKAPPPKAAQVVEADAEPSSSAQHEDTTQQTSSGPSGVNLHPQYEPVPHHMTKADPYSLPKWLAEQQLQQQGYHSLHHAHIAPPIAPPSSPALAVQDAGPFARSSSSQCTGSASASGAQAGSASAGEQGAAVAGLIIRATAAAADPQPSTGPGRKHRVTTSGGAEAPSSPSLAGCGSSLAGLPHPHASASVHDSNDCTMAGERPLKKAATESMPVQHSSCSSVAHVSCQQVQALGIGMPLMSRLPSGLPAVVISTYVKQPDSVGPSAPRTSNLRPAIPVHGVITVAPCEVRPEQQGGWPIVVSTQAAQGPATTAIAQVVNLPPVMTRQPSSGVLANAAAPHKSVVAPACSEQSADSESMQGLVYIPVCTTRGPRAKSQTPP